MDQTRSLESFLAHVQQRDPHQSEFAQAVREVMTTLWPFLEENPRYRQMAQSGAGQPRVARAV